MKSFVSIAFAAVMALAFAFNSFAAEQPAHEHEHAAMNAVYHCPMHPEVTGQKGDSCPKCGMKLVKAEQAVYHCPMHPEVTGHKGDSCPKCGMNLVPANDMKHGDMKDMKHMDDMKHMHQQ
ncbi:heavy metal-binding domain-containing protein [Shewanella mangrovi]|uniref:heavy metal-binding domain-containing protein n=1 Tax=Shewanella mangrovi TaxID=1515746 RepID=UPI000691D83D|nr:heavy metal-binding domain-containing protein [Shewanella mangrovi]